MFVFAFPNQVNERAARLVAAAVAALSALALWTGGPWLPAILAVGFLLRVAWGPRVSPLAKLAVAMARRLGPPVWVPGRPKRFAQGIGAGVTLGATLLALAGLDAAQASLLLVLTLVATLEAAAGVCCGCWLFGRLQAAGWVAADACEVCRTDVEASSPTAPG